MNNIKFTGERVVPNNTTDPQTMTEHLLRYSFATRWAKVKSILDVACGTGYGLKIMGMQGAELYGADIDQLSVAFAENFNNQKGFNNFKVINFDTDNIINFFTLGFDLITSFETIEHLNNPDNFLKSCFNVLSQSGKFIYSIPLANPSKFHKVVYGFNGAIDLIEKYFEHEYIYIQNGFEIINLQKITGNRDDLNKRGIFLIGVCRKKL